MDRPLLQMLELATTGSRAGSQALGEVCHCLVDVVLWQLFPDGLQSNFQLINRLGLRLELMVYFQYDAPTSCDSPMGSDLERLGG